MNHRVRRGFPPCMWVFGPFPLGRRTPSLLDSNPPVTAIAKSPSDQHRQRVARCLMRLARFVVCLSLLSAAAVAQTPTSSQSGTSGQSNPTDTTLQTGDVNQAVQNPLGSANQTQTPTEKKSQAATFDAGSATTAGQDQVVGEVRMMTGYSEIAGDR